MELRVVVDTRLIGLGYVRADRGTADDGWRSSPLASSALPSGSCAAALT